MIKYRLTVSGTIEFHEDGRDEELEGILLDKKGGDRCLLAIQELEESATDLTVTMEEIKK